MAVGAAARTTINIPVIQRDAARGAYSVSAQQERSSASARASARSERMQPARALVSPKRQTAPASARFTGIKRRDDGTVEVPVFKMYGPDGKPRIYYGGGKPETTEAAPAPEAALQKGAVFYGPDAKPRDAQDTLSGIAAGGKTAAVARSGGSSRAKNDEGECKTCASRRYQDGSDDSGVSFQRPTHIGAEASVAAVAGHENEHVTREAQDAENNDQRVIISNVRIHMAQCPECKKMYAAGGITETVKAPKKDEDLTLEGVGMFLDAAV